MVILVTGSDGFIGRSLMTGKGFDIRQGCSILDTDALAEAAQGCEAVIHLAAISGIDACEYNPESAWATNVKGTHNVCKLGLPVVFASTAGAIKSNSVYAETKRQGEAIVRSHAGTVLRLANVYGPNMERKQSLIANIQRYSRLTIRGGEQRRDFIHVSDVGNALTACLYHKGTFTAATGRAYTVNEVLAMARRYKPLSVYYTELGSHEVMDGSCELNPPPGWKPLVTLEQGLEELLCCS